MIHRRQKIEELHCKAFIEYADLMANVDWRWSMIHHSRNEGKSKGECGKAKAMGMRRGYPDYIVDVPCGGYHGMRIEMKAPGKKARKEQIEWLARLDRAGYHVIITYSSEEAIDFVAKYFALRPGQRFQCQVLTSAPSNVIPLRR